MKLLMHILKNNEKLGLDNEKLDSWEIRKKLSEEYREVCEAITEYDYDKSQYKLKEIIRETFDLIQVCILILFRANVQAKKFGKSNLIARTNEEHNEKLKNRSWEFGEEIDIDVKTQVKTRYICKITNLECIRCNPGACGSRGEIIE